MVECVQALGEAAPGSNILDVALFGYHVAGLAGALSSLGAISPGPFVLVVLAVRAARRWQSYPYQAILLMALAPVTVGLMLSGCLLLLRGFTQTISWVLFGLALAGFLLLPCVHPLLMLLAGGAIGAPVLG